MPFPIGCSAIAVPVEIEARDNYWFAALFEVPKEIRQADFLKLYVCIAGFLPLFELKIQSQHGHERSLCTAEVRRKK